MAKDDSSCFDDPPPLALTVGYILTAGILISYLPQFYSIISRRSSEGVSVLTMWLSFVCAYLTFANAFMLDWDAITCCRYLDVGQIIRNLLPLEQLFVGPFCLFFLFICIVYYFDMRPTGADRGSLVRKRRERFAANVMLTLNFVLLVSIALAVMAFIVFVGKDEESYKGFAYALGLTSSIIILFVWLPQIWTTFRTKDTGSLSIVMLLIQAPGNIVVVCFQAILAGNNWTTWLPYVITAAEQLTLVAMYIWYKCIKRRRSLDIEIIGESTEKDIGNLEGGSSLSPYLQIPTDNVPELGYAGDDSYDAYPKNNQAQVPLVGTIN